MKLKEVRDILNARVFTGEELLESEVNSACGCDLMSDVLAFVKDHALLLTGLINPQVIRTAEMMDITAIVFVRGKAPGEDIINMAKSKDMVLMSTEKPLYIASGLLYINGLRAKEGAVSDV